MTSIKVGQTVETTSEQQGVVRYVGPIHVSDGIFIGIELSTPTGKNDGAVRGERYFTCSPGHGLFIRDSSIAQIISQAPPPRPTPTPSGTRRPPPPTTRPRPASVVPPKTAPPRPSTVKRQSVATASTNPPLRNRTASVASSSAPIPETPLRPSGSRQSLASSAGQGTAKASRDNNIETLQTKIRHLEKQHAEDQERLRELNQVKDERDRFNGIIQKLQAKCQAQYAETQDLKEKAKQLQSENEALDRAEQDHEVDLEDALVDKEMAEERADLAEAEVESLRKRLEESTLELDILRDEAEMFTTEMSEEQKEEAGYYRLQHENDRLRNALITLKEIRNHASRALKPISLSWSNASKRTLVSVNVSPSPNHLLNI
jgi:dynactin 1